MAKLGETMGKRRSSRVSVRSLKELDGLGLNRYEAVLIAASRARQINAQKLAYQERGDEEAATELRTMKMTTNALDALLDGKIEIPKTGRVSAESDEMRLYPV